MTTRRYRRWLVGLGALVALSALAYLAFGRSKFNERNFDKIRPEMSLSEVEAILGKGEPVETPGGDINELSSVNRIVPKEQGGKPIKAYRWRSGKNVGYVYFVGDNCDKNIFVTGSFP